MIAVFVIFYGVMTFMSQIESAVFLTQLPPGTLPRLFLMGMLVAAPFSVISVLVLRNRRIETAPTDRNMRRVMPAREWAWKLAVIASASVVLYFTFLNRRHAASWIGLGAAALNMKRDAQARAGLLQAARVQGDPDIYRDYAQLALRVGRDDIAADAAQTYMAHVGLGERSGQYGAFLAALAHEPLTSCVGFCYDAGIQKERR